MWVARFGNLYLPVHRDSHVSGKTKAKQVPEISEQTGGKHGRRMIGRQHFVDVLKNVLQFEIWGRENALCGSSHE